MKMKKFTNIALGFRPDRQEIKALSDKLSFGKYKRLTVEQVIGFDANYILWLDDEKICKVSETVLKYAEDADIEQRLDEAMDGELQGMRFWDIYNDD